MTEESIASKPSAGRAAKQYALGVQTVYVLLGNLVPLVIGWPLQIYVSRVLGAEGIGIYALIEGSLGAVGVFLGLGIGQAAVRFLPAHIRRGEIGHAIGLARNGVVALSVIGVLGYLVVLVGLKWVDDFWPALAPYRWEIGVMALFIPLTLVSFFLQQCLRGMNAIGSMIFGTMLLQQGVRAVAIVAVLAVGWQLQGYILANIFAIVCGTLWLGISVRQNLRPLGKAPAAKGVLPEWRRYALICYSESLVGAVGSALEQLILGMCMGPAAVGVLSVARQLRQLPERFNQMLLMTGAPMLSAAHGQNNPAERQHLYSVMTRWSVAASLPIIFFLLFFGREVLALYGPEFAVEGEIPLAILTLAQLFSLLCGPLGNVAMMSGLEKQGVTIIIWQTILTTLALAPFVVWWGVIGAAIVLAGNVIFNNIAFTILARRKLSLYWWDRGHLAWLPVIAASLAVGWGAVYFWPPAHPGELALVAIVMYGSAMAAMVAIGLPADDRIVLRDMRQRVAAFLIGRGR